MKKQGIILTIFLVIITGCKTSKTLTSGLGQVKEEPAVIRGNNTVEEKINFSAPETWILGYFRPEQLNRQPYSQWFVPGYDQYQYDEAVIRKLLDMEKQDVSIMIVMGTWCPDSRREVPRFMKILNAINFPLNRVQLLGVDNAKIAPVDNYNSLVIQRVPTFIFFVKNVEAGRIIENPSASLEQDMLNILTKKE